MKRITKYDVRLVKESASNYEYDTGAMNNPYKVYRLINAIFDLESRCEEHFVMLALDTKLKVVGAFDIHSGTTKSSLVSTKSVFTRAMLCNANSIVVAHNHPSGNPKPSREDISVTRNLEKAGELLEIHLIDHVIVGEGDYYSFKNEGEL